MSPALKNGSSFECENCKKKIYRRPSEMNNHVYCSTECCYEHRRKTGITKLPPKLCLICKKPISRHNEKYCSEKCYGLSRNGKPFSEIHKKRISKSMKKSQKKSGNNNWKGGITEGRTKLYNSNEYKQWRSSIIKRDKYTCQKCGVKDNRRRGITVIAHHIKSFSEYPKLRLDINNGMTLCKECHRKEHNIKGGFRYGI